MEVLLMAVMAASNIVCFIIGAKVGQTVSNGEKVETPTVNPLKAYREHQERKEAQQEQNVIEAMLYNIDVYDGTGNGQRDVPGR